MAKEDAPRDDNWVDRLVEDPANPPQLQVLTGYRGRSAQEGNTRLYFDPELTGWVDVPDDAILLTRESQDEMGLGRTLVWTRLDAQVQTGPQASGTGAGAEWFQGQVAQDLGAGAGAGAGAGFQVAQTALCQTRVFCRTPVRPCITGPSACCPSPLFRCPPTRQQPWCPPSPLVRCPGPVTVDFQCQFTSNPQICNQVATPNPGCIPIDIPGTPVIQPGDFGQFGGFGQQGAQDLRPDLGNVEQFRFTPVIPCQIRTAGEPQCFKTHLLICEPPPQTPWRTPACPMTPACPQTPGCPWDPRTTITPQVGTPVFGGGFGRAGQGFEAQGGMGAEAFTQACPQTQICPQTQFCPLPPRTLLCPPRTSLCPVTQNIGCIRTLTCPRTTLCPQSQICPVTQDCPFEPIPFDQQFGGGFGQGFGGNEGGGGFGQGFEAQGEMGAQATQLCQPQTGFCPIPATRFCPVAITRNIQCIRTVFCPRTLTCPTAFCPQTPVCPRSGFCPVTPGCPWGGPGGGGDPWGGGGGFGGGF